MSRSFVPRGRRGTLSHSNLSDTVSKWFCVAGAVLLRQTQAQGSKNAPLVCGRVAALISRMTQATFGDQVYSLQTAALC